MKVSLPDKPAQKEDFPQKSRHFRAEIIENSPVGKGFYLLNLKPLNRILEPEAGQFLMLNVSDTRDPLLKRPFSVFRYAAGNIHVLYQVRGRGTTLLSSMKVGTEMDALGPLGNFYAMPPKGLTPVIAAGGIGIASLFPLIEKLSKKALVFYGSRTKEELVFLDELNEHSAQLHMSTDDGTYGIKGTVFDALRNFSFIGGDGGFIIYACGPTGMLRAVAEFAVAKNITGYASLEEKMACGYGVCLGCAVKTIKGYERVCKDGPVFKLKDILWQI